MASDQPAAAPESGAVLIVDDDHINRLLLTRQVEQMGRRVLVAEHGSDALETLGRHQCDLILLDIMKPEMDGRDLLGQVKGRDELRNIPVIVISGLGETQTAARCIEIGAEDFLIKPVDPVLLHARIRASLEKKRLRDQEAGYLARLLLLQADLDRRNRELQQLNERLEEMALTDDLTGLPNRRSAMAELQRCWSASTRSGQSMACLIIDIDGFKRINDAYGHDAGDAVLRAVAQRLRSACRQSEVVCRLGGEEFVAFCETCDRKGGAICAERLRAAVSAAPFEYALNLIPTTVSVGVAVRTPGLTNADDLLKAADGALYAAKEAGRDCVRIAD